MKKKQIQPSKLFLYLARRDKKEIKILSEFPGKECAAMRIQDIKTLHLPAYLEAELESTIKKHGLLWEVWLENATSFDELKNNLKKRGYKELPIYLNPMHMVVPKKISSKQTQAPKINTTFVEKKKTMAQKGKL